MDIWNYNIFWQEALSQIREDYKTNGKEQEFLLWFTFDFLESRDKIILVAVPSAFFRDQLISRGYINLLEHKLFELSGTQIKIEFTIKSKVESSHTVNPSAEASPVHTPPLQAEISSSVQKNHPQLRADYNFKTFVIGDNNSFAYNAACAVAKNPGKAYNPVLIYGGVGLGKTHLMQAIGNLSYNENNSNIIYLTAENFTNEFIQSINTNTTNKFKNKYRNADILLIDDIHFLQNKTETQEELFHTFNALYDSYKQMVFTCDRPVSELKNLSDRLRSRFERGLNVDLQPPKYETRRAILEKKLEILDKHIDSAVIDLIAENVVSNVRDLEASLTKLIAYTELVGKNVTLEIAQQQLKDTFSAPKQGNISIDAIQKIVADHYNLSFTDLKGKKRTKNVMLPRQIAMYIARELTEYSTTELGAEFGGRDHTTVMHSCQKIDDLLKSDPVLSSTLNALVNRIKEYKK
ncbi:MAG TPA: chromosomal replication initiator protein DnaA [Treponemataceae bacterium]|nr:chromosomal replication initiator protein DnaA [Treponemataceae bacterium]HQL05908.1 chromosomal replication initiator protein DnaA [Treponemataceae bacterium]